MSSDKQMRETVRRARELMAFVSPDPDHWDDHNREIAAALCNEELPALCNDNDTLRAELARVTAERDALRGCLKSIRRLVRRQWSHDDECEAGGHADCGPTHQQLPSGAWGTAWRCHLELAEGGCKRSAWRTCSCGVGPLLGLLESGGVPEDGEDGRANLELDNATLRGRADGRLDGLREARDLARRAADGSLVIAAEQDSVEARASRRAIAAGATSIARDIEDRIREVSRG